MIKFFIIFLAFIFLIPSVTSAQDKNQFITIVNPVRISAYSSNPPLSLATQYNQVKLYNLPASWLLTYDAISYPNITKILTSMDKNQDIGIFMEVTENFSKAAGVKYNKTDSWYRSTSIFLSGYSQSDRIKLIDTVFNKFKNELGYYPTSVGAWWIDSYSLEYMQGKYGVNANLVVADQLGTDGYTIWGQFWGTPFYPSKNHTAIPAQNLENKLDVVNIQWAARDPLNGYLSPSNLRPSLYSSQDYSSIGLPQEYFEKLIDLYAKQNNNKFGQITFGLEGDFEPHAYALDGAFEQYIEIAKKFQDTGEFSLYNMKQFSEWYRKNYSLSPPYLIESDDLLGKNVKAVWYQTTKYRIGLVIDKSTKNLKIVDLKIYSTNFQEPFFISTNKQLDLYIRLPSVVDISSSPENFVEFKDVNFKYISSKDNFYKILFDKNRSIDLKDDKIIFNNFSETLPQFISKSSYVNVSVNDKQINIVAKNKFPYDETGYTFRALTAKSTSFLRQRKVLLTITLFLIFIPFFIYWSIPKKLRLILIIFLTLFSFSLTIILYLRNSEIYYVSQSELDALFKLKTLPGNKVLVLDRSCLQCNWKTKYKIAAYDNKRNYVGKISHKDLIFDKQLVESHAIGFYNSTKIKREEAKNYLRNLGVDYVYLVKHEDYQENIPYSPGDLGVEQIFINSDAQIWKVKDKSKN